MTVNKTLRLMRFRVTLGVVLMMSGFLSGCARMLRHFGYEPIPKTPVTQPLPVCRRADVLITNLTVPRDQRHYQRPDGHPCDEVSHHEA